MRGRFRSRHRSLSAVAVAAALVAAGCGSSASSSAGSSSSSSGSPVRGGTVTFGEYNPQLSMDPTQVVGDGVDGGTEMAAVYGLLVRYDLGTRSYVPDLARSLTPNGDNSVWTLRLRPNVTFSDGSPFDAQAVVENLQRFKTARSSSANAALFPAFISSITAPDSSTVVFTLTEPWAGFPYLLASSSGSIAAPSYLAELAAGNSTATPIGAGPFKVASFRPGEELDLVPNTTYYAGAPYLAHVNFVSIPGGSATLEAFSAGQLQVAFLHDPVAAHQAIAQNLPRYTRTIALDDVTELNQRPGSPLDDVQLRKALAEAIDPTVVNLRDNQGDAVASNLMFPPGTPFYYPGEKSPTYDPADAKRLVRQVEATDGWNGTLRYLDKNTPDRINGPVAIESLLRPAGINISVTTVAQTYGQIVKGDFNTAYTGVGLSDAEPFAQLYRAFYSTSRTNTSHYKNPQMDAAINALRVAATPQARSSAVHQLVGVWNSTYPMIVNDTLEEAVVHKANVHGLAYTLDTETLLSRAWIS